ncbi:MAG: HAD family hydrolase [Promethearchaeota archaeon]
MSEETRIRNVSAILFDLHLTITDVTDDLMAMTRKASKAAGFDLSRLSDDEIRKEVESVVEWFNVYQVENDVDIHYGQEIEHWTDFNRNVYSRLGFENLNDETLHSIEREWKRLLDCWEEPRPDAVETLRVLHKRGYTLGLCTRRQDNPAKLLRKWGILDLFSTIQWSAVPGYAKPYPYTLILAAHDIGVNPHRCAFVGNSVDADIMAAKRAGMVPILATWAYPTMKKETPDGTHIIGELSDLTTLFSALPR